ncbi:hypothetical protein [Lysinibacter sp. HNR]|uniref:hypothetical protein n=1 Tax=Lysinibacter sp. HNR TaxID=3031408 RepID=UPI0024358FEA|nr:hypothetical protein [Lysinibacter sp. HNR]WGD36987.1 hypothetical protein FrondiHNR_11140 [Lysinibacter sp. HNR]
MSKDQGKPSRIEHVLAYAIAVIIGLSILSFLSVLIASLLGFERSSFTQGVWPIVTAASYVGLPLGFVLIMTLLILGMIRRRAQTPDAKKGRQEG